MVSIWKGTSTSCIVSCEPRSSQRQLYLRRHGAGPASGEEVEARGQHGTLGTGGLPVARRQFYRRPIGLYI
jgi:hypothetical protein